MRHYITHTYIHITDHTHQNVLYGIILHSAQAHDCDFLWLYCTQITGTLLFKVKWMCVLPKLALCFKILRSCHCPLCWLGGLYDGQDIVCSHFNTFYFHHLHFNSLILKRFYAICYFIILIVSTFFFLNPCKLDQIQWNTLCFIPFCSHLNNVYYL